METLVDVLEQENAAYEKLLVLSEEKTPVIIKGNIEKLQAIIDKEQPIIETVQRLEKKRAEVINDIAIVLNKDVESINIKAIIETLKKQPEEQSQLAEVHDKLSDTLKKMSAINENNKMLLEQSLEMIDFEINLYHSMKKAPETANYGKDACNTGDVLINSNGFDAKQ
jgi:flagellar biosynthesis/type III secretory pathway chaperone